MGCKLADVGRESECHFDDDLGGCCINEGCPYYYGSQKNYLDENYEKDIVIAVEGNIEGTGETVCVGLSLNQANRYGVLCGEGTVEEVNEYIKSLLEDDIEVEKWETINLKTALRKYGEENIIGYE